MIFIGILQVLRLVFLKVQDFGNFELSPMLREFTMHQTHRIHTGLKST